MVNAGMSLSTNQIALGLKKVRKQALDSRQDLIGLMIAHTRNV
jgi:hypothetical protein